MEYASHVFNDKAMQERLPKSVYRELRKIIEQGLPLEPSIAEVVAAAMKEWAIEKGATHYSHWFQPMTGITAEKHNAFMNPTNDGKVILEFSGKELVSGESDASSFPSGGLRATFEARGYTAWDPTSSAFLKEDTGGISLYIPTAFYSHNGEALDKKVPLLKSMATLNKEALRVLKLLNQNEVNKVTPTVGAEQEYFLIKSDIYKKREDLIITGRTLFGAKPPKGQEMEYHYYGAIKEKIAAFMKDVDVELWRLGVPAKTKHNEAAPAQHELALVYEEANIATDHNQLTMEILKKVAIRHGLECLLHEKPFKGINGSGKHNNWSIATDTGENLLDPKYEHFLLFISAVIEAFDKYAGLLRSTTANTGNDHRLGGHEAPPCIISIFLGEELTNVLENIEVVTDLNIQKNITDRNRTSPVAFTGNKFEFRMVPSSISIADPNTVMNTIVADSLRNIANELENGKKVNEIIKEIMSKHKRIIFNGNGYAKEWIEEAEKRGLKNIRLSVEALKELISKESIELFERHNVFTKEELISRYNILVEQYIRQINIEGNTMLDMCESQIFSACLKYQKLIARDINEIKQTGLEINLSAQEEILIKLSELITKLYEQMRRLKVILYKAGKFEGDIYERGLIYNKDILEEMSDLRDVVDKLELLIPDEIWPLPTYKEILFST